MLKNNKRQTKEKIKLKAKAERILEKKPLSPFTSPENINFKRLYHELQVHRVELEMQNEELYRTQEELLESREKFVNLYNLAPVSYFTLNRLGLIKDCNFSALRLLNTSKALLEGKRFENFIYPPDSGIFHHFLRTITSSETKHSCTVKFKLKNSNFFYGLIEGVNIQGNSGEKLYYIGVIDITDKKEIELKLKENKENLEMALLSAKAGTWSMDLETNNIFWDHYNHLIHGLEPGKFNGEFLSFLTILHSDDRQGVTESLQSALQGKTELNMNYRVLLPDKTIQFVRSVGRLVLNEGKSKRFMGISMDLTEQKKLEEEAFKLKLEQQKKILNAVIQTQESERKRISESMHNGLAQLLYAAKLSIPQKDSRKGGYTKVFTLLEEAIKQTRTMSFELAPVILKDFGLVAAIEELISRLSNEQLSIETEITGLNSRLPEIIETSAYRIIQELLNNIIKHASASRSRIKLQRISNLLIIEAIDNGVGFDSTTDMLYKKGIGLHSVKNRIELLNGELEIYSTPGAGTMIVIRVALREDE